MGNYCIFTLSCYIMSSQHTSHAYSPCHSSLCKTICFRCIWTCTRKVMCLQLDMAAVGGIVYLWVFWYNKYNMWVSREHSAALQPAQVQRKGWTAHMVWNMANYSVSSKHIYITSSRTIFSICDLHTTLPSGVQIAGKLVLTANIIVKSGFVRQSLVMC